MASKRKLAWIGLAIGVLALGATGVDATFRNLGVTGAFTAVTGAFSGRLTAQPPTLSGDALIWGSPAQLASLVLGAPTGGNQGTGTLNATGVFVNGVAVANAGPINTLPSQTGTYDANNQSFTNILNLTASVASFVSATISNYATILHLQHDGTLNVNVPPFSADPTGTNLSPGVQAAIYAACNTTNPPTGTPLLTATASLYIPQGTYKLPAPLREPCQNLTWYGDGPHFTKFTHTWAGNTLLADSWGTNIPALTATDFGAGNMLVVPFGGGIAHPVDLAEYANSTGSNNFAAKCVASGCGVSIIYKPTSSTTNTVIFGSFPASPGTGNGMYKFTYGGTGLTPEIRIATSGGTLLFTCPLQTISTVVGLEWDWDKTTYYAWEFLPSGLAVACGATQASTNPPLEGTFENMLTSGGNFQFWPHGSSTQQTTYGGDTYSILLEQGPIHTSAWTAGSGKLTNDSNTYILENFDTSPDGFQLAYRGAEVTPDIYLTVWGSGNIGYVSGMVMHDMELCVSNFTFHGMVVNDSNNSLWYNLGCSNGYYGDFQLGRQDFNSVFRDSTGFGGHFSLGMGDNFANGHIQNYQADGVDGACEVTSGGGGGTYIDNDSRCTDRGSLQYCRIENQNAGASIDNFSIDQEGGSEPQWVTCLLMNAPAAPYTFKGGNVNTRNSAPYIKHVGSSSPGSTFIDFNMIAFGNSAPASSVVSFSGTGSSTPYRFINPSLPTGNSGAGAKVPFTNLGPWSVILDDGPNVLLLNDTGTGTTANTLTKGVTASSATTAVIMTTTDSSAQVIGVCKNYCGTAGAAEIQTSGATKLLADATAWTAGDWLVPSATVNGAAHDTGISSYTSKPPYGYIGVADQTATGSTALAATLTPAALPSTIQASLFQGTGTAGIAGGGSLSTGSNSFAGTITAAAATSNVLTPGFTCPNAVVGTFQDDTTAGGVKVTAQNATTITFSATAADVVEYLVSCR